VGFVPQKPRKGNVQICAGSLESPRTRIIRKTGLCQLDYENNLETIPQAKVHQKTSNSNFTLVPTRSEKMWLP
jgi:hypothetical protein